MLFAIRNETEQDIVIDTKEDGVLTVLAGGRIFINGDVFISAIFPKAIISIKNGVIKIKEIVKG